MGIEVNELKLVTALAYLIILKEIPEFLYVILIDFIFIRKHTIPKMDEQNI